MRGAERRKKPPPARPNRKEACSHISITEIGVYHSYGEKIFTYMNYGTTTYIYGPSFLPLTYSKEELNMLIDEYINKNVEFSFTQLCNHVLSIADQQNKLKKEPNTSYSQIYLTHPDTIILCKNLWERIWKQELIQVFNNPHDMYHNSGDTYFVVNK